MSMRLLKHLRPLWNMVKAVLWTQISLFGFLRFSSSRGFAASRLPGFCVSSGPLLPVVHCEALNQNSPTWISWLCELYLLKNFEWHCDEPFTQKNQISQDPIFTTGNRSLARLLIGPVSSFSPFFNQKKYVVAYPTGLILLITKHPTTGCAIVFVAVDHLQWKAGNLIIVAGPFDLNLLNKIRAGERGHHKERRQTSPKNGCCKNLRNCVETWEVLHPSKKLEETFSSS